MEIQDSIAAVSSNFKDVEGCINNLTIPAVHSLGNTAYLNYETDLEKQNVRASMNESNQY
jgi:hypothetical protein